MGKPRTYRGNGGERGCVVTVDGRPLPPRLDIPAFLAFAILSDHLGDDDEAERFYHAFKRRVIVGLPEGDWTLTSANVDRALEEIRAERQAAQRRPPYD